MMNYEFIPTKGDRALDIKKYFKDSNQEYNEDVVMQLILQIYYDIKTENSIDKHNVRTY